MIFFNMANQWKYGDIKKPPKGPGAHCIAPVFSNPLFKMTIEQGGDLS